MAWVVASQTEDAPPDGDVPVNLDGALVTAGSPVLLSFDWKDGWGSSSRELPTTHGVPGPLKWRHVQG